MRYVYVVLIIFALGSSRALFAQDVPKHHFPIVKGYGGIYKIENVVEKLDKDKEVKILVDLVSGSKSPDDVSFYINRIARLMNLHGIEGVPIENLHVKVIVHGGAVVDLLRDEHYLDHFEITHNPNIPALEALSKAGADIIVCGQSLIKNNIDRSAMWTEVETATSALTTITKNVADGYVLLKF